MGTFLQLLLREGAMLALLSALGSGFAAWARPEGAWGSRLALAPVFGLAAGVALTTTTAELIPMKEGAWYVVLPACVISLAVAAFSLLRRRPSRADFKQLGALLALALVVASVFNVPLAARDSLGPIAYRVYDSPGYAVEAYEYTKYTLRELRPFAKFDKQGDLTKRYASYIDSTNQQVGYDPVASSANRFFRWSALSDQSAFMIALLVVGAFGLFAALRSFAPRSPMPFALLGGVLYAGPFFFELFLDGSQGALSGLALIAPVVIGARQVIAGGAKLRDVVLFGVLLAGIQTAYPYLIMPVAVGAAFVLAALFVLAWRRRTLSWPAIGRAAIVVAGLLVLAFGLSPVATSRTATYFADEIKSGLAITKGLPVFDLTAGALPSWLLQTREWYFLPPVLSSGLHEALAGVIAPLALLGVIVVGFWRFRWSLLLLPIALAAILLAAYYDQKYDCSYCVQRSLLPVAPLAAAGVGVGLAALWSVRRWWTRALAVGGALCVLVVVGQLSSVGVRRGIDGAEVVPAQLRALLPAVHGAPGPLYLEAIGQGPMAPFTEPSSYHVVQEATDHRVALSTESDDFLGLAYLGGPRKAGSEYTPLYRWVLTRAAGIRTPRRVVERRGPFALERRTVPFDIAVTAGISLDTIAHDPNGTAWVHSPAMGFWVSALSSKTAYVRMTFAGQAAGLRVLQPANAVVVKRSPRTATFCMPLPGLVGLRRLTVQINRPEDQATAGPRPEFSELPVPGKRLKLAAMSASTRPCKGGR